jgi:ribosome maturation factor RimP
VAKDLSKAVAETAIALGYELVDLESSGRGMIRVFIDHPKGISVGDCEKVSNHLTRVFAVEEIEFDRLEVSSPGLDRPIKTAADFKRFTGSRVKVRLNAPVDGRKRFDAIVHGISADVVEFVRLESVEPAKPATTKSKPGAIVKQWKEGARIDVPLAMIEKVRLNPDVA